jgi:hypothetical protein
MPMAQPPIAANANAMSKARIRNNPRRTEPIIARRD